MEQIFSPFFLNIQKEPLLLRFVKIWKDFCLGVMGRSQKLGIILESKIISIFKSLYFLK